MKITSIILRTEDPHVDLPKDAKIFGFGECCGEMVIFLEHNKEEKVRHILKTYPMFDNNGNPLEILDGKYPLFKISCPKNSLVLGFLSRLLDRPVLAILESTEKLTTDFEFLILNEKSIIPDGYKHKSTVFRGSYGMRHLYQKT